MKLPGWNIVASVAGNARIDDAKMTGMTPPVFTLSGMCVLDPPYIRRPTIRLAYCTVTRRWPSFDEHDGADHGDHQHDRGGSAGSSVIWPVRS